MSPVSRASDDRVHPGACRSAVLAKVCAARRALSNGGVKGRSRPRNGRHPSLWFQATASARKTRWTGRLEQGAQRMPPRLTFEPDRNPHLLLPRRSVHTSVVRAASPYPSCARARTQLTRRDTFAPPCAQVCSTARSRRATSTLDLFWCGCDLAVPAVAGCARLRVCVCRVCARA